MRGEPLLGGLTPAAFLRRYWQKKPLLVREAIAGFHSPITPSALTRLVCRPEVESRLIERIARKPYWRVRHGPFSARDFRRMRRRNWTLLVQDADKHIPALAAVLDRFRFLPNWRVDDLMVSFAADGGGVGPHADAYDVFLLQAEGLRRWQINTRPHREAELPDLPLKQVRDFHPQQSWLLRPGDLLYLPPGVAHHGVALGPCLSFSIGLRMPSDRELLAGLTESLLGKLDPASRYADPGLRPSGQDPGYLAAKTRRALRRRLQWALRIAPASFDEWLGRFLTEPKPWLAPAPPPRPCSAARLRTHLSHGGGLRRHPGAGWVWCETGRGQILLFAGGTAHRLPAALRPFVQLLCRARDYPAAELCSHLQRTAARALLVKLINQGLVYFS